MKRNLAYIIFTFHDVSINTYYILLFLFSIYLYIPRCFY